MLNGKHGPLWYRSDPRQTIRELPGVGSRLAPRVIEDLGDGDPDAALVVIERNPFSLVEVDGIGFRKADRIAKEKFEIGPDDERRHEAGNRWILEQRGVLGERDYFAERVKLELRDPAYKEAGAEVEEGLYWLPEELEAEKGLERWMRGLPSAPEPLPELTPAQAAICQRLGLDEVQAGAVRMALHTRVLCLTGGAGCGKTHVVAALSMCLLADRRTVRGMAFAGKAADRMREAFDQYGVMAEATTIHKALGYQKKAFTVEMLGEDLIVIDEASMLPNWLLWAVVNCLRPGAHLILVGDPNQLPPDVTHALVSALEESEDPFFRPGMRVWEPACGQGHISRVLEARGYLVSSSDLHDRGYGRTGVDFLASRPPPGTHWMITNPPFGQAEAFIRHALTFGIPFAFLLKGQFWHAARRESLFWARAPLTVAPLTWRPDFLEGRKGGSPTMEAAWTVWDREPAFCTGYFPLRRPEVLS